MPLSSSTPDTLTPCHRRPIVSAVLLALVFTASNAFKPLHVDDATFYWNAAQDAAHPLDPYGFGLMRYNEPVPANHALAPPVLPYWWALGIRLFGQQPFLWKLWLLPFALVLVLSLLAILRRFAPGLETPLLWLILFSPVFLPGFNLMMDIPATALGLGAVALFLRAADRHSSLLAVLAGLVAGLAMETKYTGFLAPAVLLVYALLFRKMGLWVRAAATAAVVFLGWETFVALRYGESHFWFQLWRGDNFQEPKWDLLQALPPILGAVCPALGLLALVADRAPGRFMLAAAVLAIFPYVLLAWPPLVVFDFADTPGGTWTTADLLFAVSGLGTVFAVAVAARLLCRRDLPTGASSATFADRRMRWFLVLWLGLEVLGYVVIDPFPAVRRVMGIYVAGVMVAGRLLVCNGPPLPTRWIRGTMAAGVLLGLGFYVIDFQEAWAAKRAAEETWRRIHEQEPDATIWYTGYWGFQYYADRLGMKQVVPDYSRPAQPLPWPAPSDLHRGDWLAKPGPDIPQQKFVLDRDKLALQGPVRIGDPLPWATLVGYYAGSTPIRHQQGPRVIVQVFRIKDDLVPQLPQHGKK